MILGNSLRGSINVCKIILLFAAAVTVMSCQQSSSNQTEQGGNRLKNEKSPYLLQHAKNPVDWYPWGDEAFARAEKENKPIFLSIGYSTCHWCNVMEEESFMDDEVAKLMNETFVNIKVDREERPDIDSLYMTVAQVMNGSGGWPLNVVMTPDKKPFFVTTYVPKGNRFGRIGLLELIPRIRQAWEEQSKAILDSADKITGILEQLSVSTPGEALGKDGLRKAYELIASRFDEQFGGFGDAPKFPLPHNYSYLLRYWYRTGDEKALMMAEESLRAMRLGGIYDQIGYGFHRYSTDDAWLVPHFEKMLHDQAMHAIAYTEAFQATGRREYEKTATEIFRYILRDMTSPKGGFYSAEDADVDGEEGKFYLWSLEEIRKTLTKEEAEFVIDLFNLEEAGNFVDPLAGGKTGENIFYLKKPLDEIANGSGVPVKELHRRWEAARKKLFDARKKRFVLRKDDKVLTDWNGLMIAAFAKGARLFNNPDYLKAARSSADFILNEMRDPKGRLLHRYRDGDAALTASLNDYAFFVWGLIELYEASFDTRYLKTALELTRDTIKHFWDEKSGGFFFIADDAEELLVRQKDTMDGPVPAGNSVAMLNMLRLGRVLADAGLEEMAAKVELLGSDAALRFPLMHTQLMIGSEFAQGPSFEVVVAGRTGAADTDKMLDALDGLFVPNKVVVFRPTESESPEITKLAVFTKNQKAMNGEATVYVCVNYNCNLPTTDLNKMIELLTVRQAPKKG